MADKTNHKKLKGLKRILASATLGLSLAGSTGCVHGFAYAPYGAYTGAKEAYVAANSNIFLGSLAAIGGAVAGFAIKGAEGALNDTLFYFVDRKFRFDGLSKPIGAFGNGSGTQDVPGYSGTQNIVSGSYSPEPVAETESTSATTETAYESF